VIGREEKGREEKKKGTRRRKNLGKSTDDREIATHMPTVANMEQKPWK